MSTFSSLKEETENMEGEIHFVRHGESRFNAGIAPDEHDCGLTDTGLQQAARLFGTVDLVIVSPLLRARQTLEHSQIKYKHMWISSLCRERKNVTACDYFVDEVIAPETDTQFARRVIEFRNLLDMLRRWYPKILVVAHGIFIMSVTGRTTPIHNCEFFQWV